MPRKETLAERIQAAIRSQYDVEPADSEWKPVAHWEGEFVKSRQQTQRMLTVACKAGIMERKRALVLCDELIRSAYLYRECPEIASGNKAISGKMTNKRKDS